VRRNDVTDSLQEGFEPSPLPPIGPDGAVSIQPLKRLPVAGPRLCEAGPCVHYHRFSTQVDAARPIGDKLGENGQVLGEAPDAPIHVQVHHYCYPTVGIETELGSLPVVECNLWEPEPASEKAARARSEAAYFETADGQRFLRELAEFKGIEDDTNDIAINASTTEGDETP